MIYHFTALHLPRRRILINFNRGGSFTSQYLSGNKDLGVSLPAADSVGYGGGTAGDAVEALIVLGYKQADAASAVSSCYEEGISVQELIRRSLKSLAR